MISLYPHLNGLVIYLCGL